MTNIRLYPGDNRESLRRLIEKGVRVHSVVTDPPYVMESVLKRFGASDAKQAKHGRDGALMRSSSRFVGKTWDACEIAWDAEFWKLVLRVLVPGGFCFAFGGPRTIDRQISAMREAGFIIYPMHAWGYSTGLPKGHPSPRGKGWVYGAAAPKVDFEPICMAMAPIERRTIKENILHLGTGDLNIGITDDGKYPSTILYHPKAGKEDRANSNHPTVKPVALLQYLIRHITPQGGVILDPFAGSGTTAEAARREGFDCILMEAEPEYIDFIHGRFNLEDNSGKAAVELELGQNSYNSEQDENKSEDVQSFDLSDLLGTTDSMDTQSVAGADLEDLLV